MRKLLIGGGVLVVGVIAAVVFLASNLDSLVKGLIEKQGSQVTGTKLSVGSVKISLSDGMAEIDGISIANPPGFSDKPAIALGTIAVTIDKSSVSANPVVIKDIEIKAPAITYELGAGGSNLDQLKKNIQNATASSGGGAPASDDKAGPQKKLVIDRLAITGGQATLAAALIPGGATAAKLGDIVLTDIGKGTNGVDGAQLAQQVLSALLNGAVHATGGLLGKAGDQVKSLLPPEASGALKDLLGKK